MGTKGVPHVPETIELARKLVIQGLSLSFIAKSVKEATGRPCSAKTVSAWKEKYTWSVPDKKPKGNALKKIQKNAQLEVQDTQRHLRSYRRLQEKGLEALENVPVKTAAEALELIDTGIKGERRIQISAWMKGFLADVINIITDEVKDEATLSRIANRFKTDLKDYVMKERQQ
jgi:hypothetical protein